MGNQVSLTSVFSSDEKSLFLSDKGLTKIPFSIPVQHPVNTLFLSGNQIQNLPKNLQNVESVILSLNQYKDEIPRNVARSLESYPYLIKLDLSENQLTKFTLSQQTLETLVLYQNKFTEVPKFNLPSLNGLALDFNLIKTLVLDSPTLATFTAALNYIDTVNIINAPMLTWIDLSKNNIKVLPDLSKCCPALKTLCLDDNFIEDFQNPLPNSLHDITCKNNLLTKIPDSILKLQSIKYLYLSGNKITHIPKLPQSLSKLQVFHNNISEFDDQSLPLMHNIMLSYNNLTKIPKTNMKGNSILVNHNIIKQINIDCLPHRLSILELSFNQIEEVPVKLFEIQSLNQLDLSFNNITIIPDQIFNSRIGILNISGNPIKALPKMPPFLEKITAAYCHIENVDGIFEKSERLRFIDLSGNQIKSFKPIHNLEFLYLSKNSLTQLPDISEKIKVIDVSYNCIGNLPTDINAPNLIVLNLSFNSLSTFPEFKEVPFLQYLKLCGNPIRKNVSDGNTPIDIKNLTYLDTIDIVDTGIDNISHNNSLREWICNIKSEKTMITNAFHYINTSKSTGYAELLGLRDSMEDSIIIRDDIHLFGVCDGHGGSNTSTFLAHSLCELFENEEKINESTIKTIFGKTEEALLKKNFHDGSTLCICYINNDEKSIISVHLGDARAIIAKNNGTSDELTIDHKPSKREEFERIHVAGGRVVKDRVGGLLAVARSLGDYSILGVGHEPTIQKHEIKQDYKYLIVCCDGVFDVLNNDQIAEIAIKSSSTTDAAYNIRNTAFAAGSLDNISVIVVDLTST